MKMIVAIVQNSDVGRLSETLVKAGVRVTKLASTGGFLRAGNTTFMIGVEDAHVDEVLGSIKRSCQPREEYAYGSADAEMDSYSAQGNYATAYTGSAQVGGATVFVMPVERFLRF